MKVLVTGAAGFIGAHLVRALLAAGERVIGVDCISDYYDPALKRARLAALATGGDFTFYQADIAADVSDEPGDKKPASPAKMQHRMAVAHDAHEVLAQHYDVVFHLAAQAGVRYSLQNPDAYLHANLIGFYRIVQMCCRYGVNHLIYASSSSVYGLNTKLPFAVGDNVDHPISLYAATKKANELIAHAYSWLHNLPCTGLRFFTVYGPWGRPDMAYYSFTRDILAGRPLRIFNDGDMWRSFTYVDDVIECMMRLREQPAAPNDKWDSTAPDAATSRAPYRLYNIGGDSTVRLTDMIEMLEKLLNKKAIIETAPLPKTEVLATHADTRGLAECVGYTPATPLAEGLARFTKWYSEYHVHR